MSIFTRARLKLVWWKIGALIALIWNKIWLRPKKSERKRELYLRNENERTPLIKNVIIANWILMSQRELGRGRKKKTKANSTAPRKKKRRFNYRPILFLAVNRYWFSNAHAMQHRNNVHRRRTKSISRFVCAPAKKAAGRRVKRGGGRSDRKWVIAVSCSTSKRAKKKEVKMEREQVGSNQQLKRRQSRAVSVQSPLLDV